MIKRLFAGPVIRLLLVTALAVTGALGAVSIIAVKVNEDTLMPELAGKAILQADSLSRRIDRALSLGIPAPALTGFQELVDTMRAGDPDLLFAALTDSTGRVILHSNGKPATEIAPILTQPAEPIVLDGAPAASAASVEQTLSVGDHNFNKAAATASIHGDFLIAEAAISIDGQTANRIIVGYGRATLLRPVTDNLEDVAIVLMVCLFLSFELMLLVLTVNLVLPTRSTTRILRDLAEHHYSVLKGKIAGDDLGQFARRLNAMIKNRVTTSSPIKEVVREPRLISVRLLAFLFVFAEELARPFMPVFFGSFATEGSGLSPEVSAGLIMTLHTAVIAVIMPVGSLIYDRVGRRRMYMIGAAFATVGLIGTGSAVGLWDLMAWRAVSAVGYALAFVACQGYVLESTGPQNRTQGAAMFVGGIMLADICGPAIGGIIAHRIGYGETFMLGAAIAALSGVLVVRLMDAQSGERVAPPKLTIAAFKDTLSNWHFLALLFLAAVPSKILLTGFFFYLVPLTLTSMDTSEAEIGRVLMIYGVLAVLLGPLFAKVTDKVRSHAAAVGVGCLIAAGGILPAAQGPEMLAIMLGVAALGIGQAMSISAQVSTAVTMTEHVIAKHGQGPVMAVLRLVERLGGSAGPLLAAFIAHHSDLHMAIGVLGVFGLACAALFMIVALIQEAKIMERERNLIPKRVRSLDDYTEPS